MELPPDMNSNGDHDANHRLSSSHTNHNEIEMKSIRRRLRRGSSINQKSMFKSSTINKYEKWSGFVERFSFVIFLTIFALYSVL